MHTFVGICLGVCKLLNHIIHIQTLKVYTYQSQPAGPFNVSHVDQIHCLFQHCFKDNLAGNFAVYARLFFFITDKLSWA